MLLALRVTGFLVGAEDLGEHVGLSAAGALILNVFELALDPEPENSRHPEFHSSLLGRKSQIVAATQLAKRRSKSAGRPRLK
jgi:hypothetical protein